MTMLMIKLKVEAGARVDELAERAPNSFTVKVREPAAGGRANLAALSLLAKHLGVPVGKLWIVKGAHKPSKIVEVRT